MDYRIDLLIPRLESIIKTYLQNKLIQKRKVVTRETFESLDIKGQDNRQFIRISIKGSEAIFFIEAGKRANTKLPVKKVGNEWKLLGNLDAWKVEVGYAGSDFQLASAIAKNSRPPIPIVNEAIKEALPEIEKAIIDHFKEYVPIEIANDLRKIWARSKR